jgi:hypothetical protein
MPAGFLQPARDRGLASSRHRKPLAPTTSQPTCVLTYINHRFQCVVAFDPHERRRWTLVVDIRPSYAAFALFIETRMNYAAKQVSVDAELGSRRDLLQSPSYQIRVRYWILRMLPAPSFSCRPAESSRDAPSVPPARGQWRMASGGPASAVIVATSRTRRRRPPLCSGRFLHSSLRKTARS